MKTTIELGKIDYDQRGRKINAVELKVELKETDKGLVFSMSGGIWNSKKTDYINCGQNCEEILSLFPNNKKVLRLVQIWREYHLNGFQAGTEKQMNALKEFKNYDYTERCNYLESIGLLFDNGYKYGSGWQFKKIPENVIEEIKELIQ